VAKLDALQLSELGFLLRRAHDLGCATKLGINVSLAEIGADEFLAMTFIAEERDRLEKEKTTRTPTRLA
jgi:hypothetical protein